MAIDVQPGSNLTVTVTKSPTNEAAAKTLSRVFGRSPVNVRARKARKALRTNCMDPRTRGGRIWMVRPKAPRLVQPQKGDTCSLLGTSALIKDLQSVSQFVDVKQA